MSAVANERVTNHDSYVENSNVTTGGNLAHELENQKLELKIAELVEKILTPPTLSRESIIKIRLWEASTDRERFPLLIELFKIKVAAAQEVGLSPQACIEEFEQVARSQKMLLTGENSDLKNELAALRVFVIKVGESIYVSQQHVDPCLELLRLEKETGVSLVDADFLIKNAELYAKLFKEKIVNPGQAWAFYQSPLQPNFHKILDYFEKEGDMERIQKVFNLYISCLVPEFDVWENLLKNFDPIAKALPYIAKYGSLDQVEVLHQLRRWPSWEKEYHWIDLQCQAAEILATTDREKAKQYLAKAEKDLQEKFVISFWFSPKIDQTNCQQYRKQAFECIEKAKLALQ